jgi:hypothetical protein
VGKESITDTIHQELCTAIAELAKSVDLAVKRMAIRAKFSAAIADAEKAEMAAEALLAAALQEHLTPAGKPVVDLQPATVPQIPDNNQVVEKLDAACRWLSEVTTVAASPKSDRETGNESAFALSLLQLHDRTGGFLKSNSDEKISRNDAALADH